MCDVFIRSQDKEKLYCFNGNVKSLQYVERQDFKQGKKTKTHHAICISDGLFEGIAEYKSKERCIEVLDEIQRVCGQYLTWSGGASLLRGGMDVQPGAVVIPRVYEMPEK